jgi:hypothetical protein
MVEELESKVDNFKIFSKKYFIKIDLKIGNKKDSPTLQKINAQRT